MKMKCWLMMLPLLSTAGVAMAQGSGPGVAGAPANVVAAPAKAQAPAPAKAQAPAAAKAPEKNQTREKAQAKHRKVRHKAKTMPRGDMRQCLDRKTNKEIIRCSETRGKK